MAEAYIQTSNSKEPKASTELALRQQEAVCARPWIDPRIKSGATPRDLSSDGFPLSAIRILRLSEVMARVGLCSASIYNHIKAGFFPKQITLGPRAVGWLEHEIDAWLELRIQARTKGGH